MGLQTPHLKGPELTVGAPSSQLGAALHASPKLVELNLVNLFLDRIAPSLSSACHRFCYSGAQFFQAGDLLKESTDAIERVLNGQTDHVFDVIRSIPARAQTCRFTPWERKMELVGQGSMVAVHVDLSVTSFTRPIGWLNTVLSSVVPPLSVSLEIDTTIDPISPVKAKMMSDAEKRHQVIAPRGPMRRNRVKSTTSRPIMKDGMGRWTLHNTMRLTIEAEDIVEP
ncbi:hypothetical protein FRB97_000293 [Tulasnella sp. 331]|nr:hypothetical protein FRB97_000293 [Tulasnella sp. 331]